MKNYLTESYGGELKNPLLNEAYFCYTIFDKEYKKYYSGSRGLKNSNIHDLGISYFTSSTVIDFVKRFKEYPNKFKIYIEYFQNRQKAFDAETNYHKKFNVGKNPNFYNVIINGGTNCGAGTILCISDDGKIYRVTCEEYHTGNHKTVSYRKSNAKNIKTGEIKKLPYDKIIGDWKHELSDVVIAYDFKTCINRRISKKEFNLNPNRYIGVTAGKAAVIDLETGKSQMILTTIIAQNPNKYVGVTIGKTTVIDKKLVNVSH